jgi:hypothetical protein
MVRDGLLSESRQDDVAEVLSRGQTKQTIKTAIWHSPSSGGEAFLTFVADPFADNGASQRDK